MATLHATSATFESVQVGDTLPIVAKEETQATINLYRDLAPTGPKGEWKNLHTDEEFARQTIFGGTVNMGVATVAYLVEVLEKAFPLRALLGPGSHIQMQAREPFRAGDVVAFTGTVVGKREAEGRRLVDVELQGTNQHGTVVARARATVPL